MLRFFISSFFIAITLSALAQAAKPVKPDYEFLFNSDKELTSLALSDASAWIISKNGNGGKCLKHIDNKQANDSTVQASMLFNDQSVGSFLMQVDVMQTPTNYNLVHLCLIFGYQGDDDFAFAQLASISDRFTHNIFQKEKDEQHRILEKQERGIDWGFEQWRHVAIERNIVQSMLKVWVDDRLVFESNDQRLMLKGRVGLGNSGDSYKLDNLKLWITE